jgi:hypothetical protein
VSADGDRKFITKNAVIGEYVRSSGKPRGHGLAGAPKDPLKATSGSEKAGYYAFDIAKKIRGISLDTIAYDGSDKGTIDDLQWQWLEKELRRNSKRYFVGGKVRRNGQRS